MLLHRRQRDSKDSNSEDNCGALSCTVEVSTMLKLFAVDILDARIASTTLKPQTAIELAQICDHDFATLVQDRMHHTR
jgi:hypothetical protein